VLEPGEDGGDLLLHCLVEFQLHPGEPGDHLSGQVIRGRPEPTAGDDQVDALAGEESQRRRQVLRPVSDAEQVGHLDAQLAQPLRQPRAVAVGDLTVEQLCPGDHDPGPDVRGAVSHETAR
jgi:hypothetical protein